MNTVIIGIGGVGGFLAGMLLEGHKDITLIARGEKGEALKENGLTLVSDKYGKKIYKDIKVLSSVKEVKDPELVFVCVKNYSLENVLEDLKEVVTENTVIVPVMNGIEPGDKIRRALPGVKVVDGVIYIVSFMTQEGYIWQQGDIVDLRLGGDLEAVPVVKQYISDLLPATYYDDIKRQIWRKYILNMAYNVETAYYDNTIGQLRDDPLKSAEYVALIDEASMIARKLGVDIRDEDSEDIKKKFYEYHYDATSSLQRDIRDGKRTESDIFTGYLLRVAGELGVRIPVTEKMDSGFKSI